MKHIVAMEQGDCGEREMIVMRNVIASCEEIEETSIWEDTVVCSGVDW